MRVRWVAVAAAVLTGTGCGTTPVAVLTAQPGPALLTVDQLVAPDFAVDVAPHVLTAADVVATNGGVLQTLEAEGFASAASEDFFRSVGTLSEVNGPVQIRDTIEAFVGSGGASHVFAIDVRRLDAVTGSTALSTGALGDEAHSSQRTAVTAGVTAIEITVEWRVQNFLNVLVVRGRAGGTRLDDALVLAHTQTGNELGRRVTITATPAPAATAAP